MGTRKHSPYPLNYSAVEKVLRDADNVPIMQMMHGTVHDVQLIQGAANLLDVVEQYLDSMLGKPEFDSMAGQMALRAYRDAGGEYDPKERLQLLKVREFPLSHEEISRRLFERTGNMKLENIHFVRPFIPEECDNPLELENALIVSAEKERIRKCIGSIIPKMDDKSVLRNRLQKLSKKREDLLCLPKSQRDELPQILEAINRIKSWMM